MSPAEILERAADYIDAHGLHKGSLGVKGGPVCSAGAINLAVFGTVQMPYLPSDPRLGVEHPEVGEARRAVEETVGGWLPDWSDANSRATVTRTLREVAAAFAGDPVVPECEAVAA